MPLYKRWQSKPWPGVDIDWTHPLAQGLVLCVPFNEGSGTSARDLVSGQSQPFGNLNNTMSLSWVSSPFGVALHSGVAGDFVGPFPVQLTDDACTLAAILSPGDVASFRMYISTTSPYEFELRSNDIGAPQVDWGYPAVGYIVPTSPVTITLGSWHAVVSTATATVASIYLDGILEASSSGGIPSNTAIPSLYLMGRGNGDATDRSSGNTLALACVWGRVLSAQEVTAWSANPWQIFQPQAGWLFNAPTGPTTATLTGPTSGALGSPSSAFTVTLDQPAGAGGVTFNVSSTVGTDTFT